MTTLRDIIEAGGYNLSELDDAEWLLSVQSEFESLVNEAEEIVEAAELEDCEHEHTHTEEVENTAEYEYNQSIGNTSFALVTTTIEICDDCDKKRNLPEGEWDDD